MKMKTLWTIVLLCCGCYAYSPIIDGALADLRVRVVDERGVIVSNASVCVTFSDTHTTVKNTEGLTDEFGRFAAKGKTIGKLRVWVRKDGHYETWLAPHFRELSVNEARKTKRWSKGPVETTVVLKKIRNPVRLVRNLGFGYLRDFKFPVTNAVVGFDLKVNDWCKPYGKGEYDDLQMKFDLWRSNKNWLQVYSSLDITMTNKLDGFYFAPVDRYSALSHVYEANTNAVYQKELHFVYDRRTGIVKKEVDFPKDKHMVFRTRTKVDDKGNLISANYGWIQEDFSYGIIMTIRNLFNPTPNDPNLEDFHTAERSRKMQRSRGQRSR